MPKAWKVSPHYSDNLVEQFLYNRSIKTKAGKDKFLNPNLEDYKKDLEIPGIEKAKKRILQAVENKELVIVYGDYDADGVCGAAVLYLGLTSLGAKVLPYIPHREKEGYGLSEEGLKSVKEKGASLVITVDNGIVANKEAEFAQGLGLDLIITDHHTLSDKKPKALAIVHSTGMSLGVNRALVKIGLEKLNKTKRIGLLALIDQSGLQRGAITAYNVGHVLGPRINAMGRLEHAMDSLRILCTKDKEKAEKLAGVLAETNDQKKKLAMDAVLQAKEMINEDISFQGKKILVLHSESWISGIVGLVAGRICDEYRKPTIIISSAEGQGKGSARSGNGFNVVEAIRQCSDILVDVGGHPRAAGFTIATENITLFRERLEKIAEMVEAEEDVLQVEAVVKTENINKRMVKDLDLFEPTGVSNPQPVLASLEVKISDIKTVGQGQHLKFTVDGIDAIAFSFGERVEDLKDGQKVDLAYYLELNKFNGQEKLQFKIIDIKLI
ncbi:MAG: Single-stranded-DNA-specific exonuclease RecJ [Candidatus Daviesbacteria bacterium GW2011_GWA2_42_7]|uniref:Single-stranded-DNA-specific exonuclease RecJ n=1 Tax=Candidatus Daviesbacteria bacterium GW2011_GWA2_42_7 TaxID=1618425 RepID=A0A0G1DDK4_9BACT|nr:MAG: Single-stranded-DNA-specific exonuclease RecJ [Candidatus Daviesbacteria bacterium GW2011_GWA2_42_7]